MSDAKALRLATAAEIRHTRQVAALVPGPHFLHDTDGKSLNVTVDTAELALKAYALVQEQAEDEGLWFRAQTAPEVYLQAALRKLHASIEGEG